MKEECIHTAKNAHKLSTDSSVISTSSISSFSPLVHYIVADMDQLTLADAEKLIGDAVQMLNEENGAPSDDGNDMRGDVDKTGGATTSKAFRVRETNWNRRY